MSVCVCVGEERMAVWSRAVCTAWSCCSRLCFIFHCYCTYDFVNM